MLSIASAIPQVSAFGPITAPTLSDDSDYSEYWEQQFLFDNKTTATSQFLIANLPFSRHHGMMVATLKAPGEDVVVIKNGRKRSGWNFEADAQKLAIFQHELSSNAPGFKLQLHNTAAELDVSLSSPKGAIPIVEKNNKLGLPEVTLYAPTSRAFGRWRDGPEIGGPGPDGEWHEIGQGFGYGLHVVQKKVPNTVMKRWRRFTGAQEGGTYEPIFHAFETPKGDMHYALILISPSGKPMQFDVGEFNAGSNEKEWKVKAKSGTAVLAGTLKLSDLLETFNLKDQLNGIEKLAAGSMADVTRFRYAASYALVLSEDGVDTSLSGNAFAEDIQMGEVKAKRRRSRR